MILVLVGLLLAVIAIPVEKKGTADEISGEREMNSGMMGNSSGSGNSSVDDNLESGMSDGEDEPLSDLEKYEAQTEQKLEELLSTVDGAGQVRVMLTWEGSSERQVEKIGLAMRTVWRKRPFIRKMTVENILMWYPGPIRR